MSFLKKKFALAVAGAFAATLGASEAQAAAELQINIDDAEFEISTYDVGTTAGTITFGQDANTLLANIGFVGGAGNLHTGFALTAPPSGYFGTISFDATGAITGGDLTIEITDGLGETDSYVADLSGGSIIATPWGASGKTITVVGLTSDGTFDLDSDDSYGLADLSGYSYPNGALSGSVGTINFNVSPGDLTDTSVFTNTFVVVPTPSAALAAIPMLGMVVARRRRSKD